MSGGIGTVMRSRDAGATWQSLGLYGYLCDDYGES